MMSERARELYAGASELPGLEVSGVVAGTGADVKGFAPGDPVVFQFSARNLQKIRVHSHICFSQSTCEISSL